VRSRHDADVRICLMVEGQEDVTWEQWLGLARACEESGLEGLFRSDHYLSVLGVPGRGSLDAWATLSALAALTERIRLGALVSPATFRHPSELAKVVATVDHVSRGRVELGLGAGWNEREHTAYGFPFPPLGERLDILAEQLEIVTRTWTEESFTFAGRHYALDDCPGLPKPLQQPRPPLITGGRAGPRALSLAARFADEYNTAFVTLEEAAARRERLLAACDHAGRDPATMRFSLMTSCIVGADRADLLARARGVLRTIGEENGDPEEFLRSRDDAWLVGTVDEIAAKLGAFEEAGVERVYLQHLAHDDLDMVALLGAEVAPAVVA
jgi:F420-dependent oxidoreductase-like protein